MATRGGRRAGNGRRGDGATSVKGGAADMPPPTPTLVVDRSFEIKTADPQRAFEPTRAIVNRGRYDTFFTYKGGDLAHPVPLLVQLVVGVEGRQDVHVPPEEERPLRQRHAADGGGRRLLVQPPDQPEGQPRRSCWTASRRRRAGRYTVILQVEDAGDGASFDPDEHVARRRELEARAKRTAAPTRSVLTRPTRPRAG